MNDQGHCEDGRRRSTAICPVVDVLGPSFSWLSPAENSRFVTYMGCTLTLPLLAQDNNDYFDVSITTSTVGSRGLPPGAVLGSPVCSEVGTNPWGRPPRSTGDDATEPCSKASVEFRWSPADQLTGQEFTTCFVVSSGTGTELERCVVLVVGRCKYCIAGGESMMSIADRFKTDWLQIWGSNVHISNPDGLHAGQLINLGALLDVQYGEKLSTLAELYDTSVESLKALNPDIPANVGVVESPDICVAPGVCLSEEYVRRGKGA